MGLFSRSEYTKAGPGISKNAPEKKPFFQVDDAFPYGHGEKSVFLIERKMRLRIDEAMAIRWHMGFSGTEDNRTVGQALQKYPLAFALATADMEASYFLEKED